MTCPPIFNFMTVVDCPHLHRNHLKRACGYYLWITRAEMSNPSPFLPLQRTEPLSPESPSKGYQISDIHSFLLNPCFVRW